MRWCSDRYKRICESCNVWAWAYLLLRRNFKKVLHKITFNFRLFRCRSLIMQSSIMEPSDGTFRSLLYNRDYGYRSFDRNLVFLCHLRKTEKCHLALTFFLLSKAAALLLTINTTLVIFALNMAPKDVITSSSPCCNRAGQGYFYDSRDLIAHSSLVLLIIVSDALFQLHALV